MVGKIAISKQVVQDQRKTQTVFRLAALFDATDSKTVSFML